MTETQERFLKVIAAHVPPERVVELHLFPSLRQGPIESGVAVVAAEPADAGGRWRAEGSDPSLTNTAETDASDAPACDPTDDAAGAAPADTQTASGDGSKETPPVDVADAVVDDPGTVATPHPPPTTRYTIYTARYRLTIKGPDRGKWEASVAAEADAPLVTLEAVVRGVRHRAGEGAEGERLSGDEFRAALAAPAWITRT